MNIRPGLIGPLLKLLSFTAIAVTLTSVLALAIASHTDDSGTPYSAIFSNASLVKEGDDIRIAGVKIGQVTRVSIHERTHAKIDFVITDRTELPSTTHVTIRYRNMVGERYIALTRKPGASTALHAGHQFPREHTTEAVDLNELFSGFRPLFSTLKPEDVNALTTSIIQVLQGESGSVANIVRTTARLTNNIADRDAVIGELMTNLNTVLATVNQREDDIELLLDTSQRLVQGLSAERFALSDSIVAVADLNAVVADLVKIGRPQVQESITELNTVSAELMKDRDSLDNVLTNLPIKSEKLTRIASYGSWFQFYLCGLDILTGPGRSAENTPGPVTNQTVYTNSAARCTDQGGA